jgi:hypothetical protein
LAATHSGERAAEIRYNFCEMVSNFVRASLFVSATGLITIAAACSSFNASSDGPTSDASVTMDVDGGGDGATLPVGDPHNDAGGDANVDAGPWTPKRIKGIAFWFDSDTLAASGSVVETWSDSSGNGNNASALVGQRPVLLSGPAGIFARNAVQFTGAQYFSISDSASTRWTTSFVFEAIIRQTTQTVANQSPLYAKESSNDSLSRTGLDVLLPTELASQLKPDLDVELGHTFEIHTDTAGLSVDTPHRVRAAFDSSSRLFTLQIDKGAAVTAAAMPNDVVGLDATGRNAMIGYDLINYLKSDVAEIVAVTGDNIDPADITMLDTYLDTKFGLK